MHPMSHPMASYEGTFEDAKCGEKSNKCNQCDNASYRTIHLRTHLKTHSGEKLNKCKQCDFAYSQAGHLRTHLKKHSPTDATSALCNYKR